MKTWDDIHKGHAPEYIKRLVELAEGFSYNKNIRHGYEFILSPDKIKYSPKSIVEPKNILTFSTLLHRAVEGFNHSHIDIDMSLIKIDYEDEIIIFYDKGYGKGWCGFCNYQPCHLTACEMAIDDCLQEVLK